jgi:hypothetical protein
MPPNAGHTGGGTADGGSSDAGVHDGGSFTAPNDGCEVDISTDAKHCGACDTPCSPDGTTSNVCETGQCKLTCDTNHYDADGEGHNGCEVDLRSDPDNCGAVNYKCSAAGASQRKCVAGQCAPVCTADFADCAGAAPAPDDGCETSITTPTNCGRCGHGCLGGGCASHVCQEITLAFRLTNPHSLVATDNYVIWVEGAPGLTTGRVAQMSLLGTNFKELATNQGYPTDIEFDGTSIFWVANGDSAVRQGFPNQTGSSDIANSKLFPGELHNPSSIAVDATNVYWGDGAYRQVWKIAKSDTTATPVNLTGTLSIFPTDIAVDSKNVYYAVPQLGYVPIDMSAGPKTIATGNGTIAMDANFVYVSGQSGAESSVIMKFPHGNVTGLQVVAHIAINASSMAVDSTYIYYWTSSGLYRVNKTTGTNPQLLSSNVHNVEKIVVHEELGGEAVYWVNDGSQTNPPTADGTILKLAL